MLIEAKIAATQLKISLRRFQQMCQWSEIKAIKQYGRWFVEEELLNEYTPKKSGNPNWIKNIKQL